MLIMYAMVELVWIPNSPLVGDIEDKDQFLMGGINHPVCDGALMLSDVMQIFMNGASWKCANKSPAIKLLKLMATFPASHNIHTYDRYVRGAWLYFLSGDNERKFVLIANGNIEMLEIYVVYFSLWYCILWVSSFQSSLFCSLLLNSCVFWL